MELVLNKGFKEMSQDEIMVTDGGVPVLVVAAGITAVCGAGWGCYEIGAAVGKFFRNIRGQEEEKWI